MDRQTQTSTPQGAGKILAGGVDRRPAGRCSRWRGDCGGSLLVPVLAVVTGLLLGGLFIVLTSEEVYAAFGHGLFDGLGTAFVVAGRAYAALFAGAIGDPVRMIAAPAERRCAGHPPGLQSDPRKPGGFDALHLRRPGGGPGLPRGLFNIGAEGQIFIGAIVAAFVGYSHHRPAGHHSPAVGAAGGRAGRRRCGASSPAGSRPRPARMKSSTRS